MTDVTVAETARTSPPSPLLDRPGAVAAEGLDTGVAWHYGDPVREQRRLEAGTGTTDLSHRGVLRVSGPDRLSWLHSMTTQHLTGLAPYTSAETLILSPHGHVEHALHLVDDGEASWITLEPGTVSAVEAWLKRMQFMLRVEVADVSAEYGTIGQVGSMVARAWDLSEVENRYEEFIDEFGTLSPQDGAAVLHAQTMMVHEWRRFPFLDPRLPADLLPSNWRGTHAAELFHRRHLEWRPAAQQHWDELD